MTQNPDLFLEVAHSQLCKHGQDICGDVFRSRKLGDNRRVIAALSDGLGSGVKANILAGMTASMALKFTASDMDFRRSADVMMDALPVCSVRRISYATFTILDCTAHGTVRLIEMDNPPVLVLRGTAESRLPDGASERNGRPVRSLRLSRMEIRAEDRIVMVSDGVTQAGLGSAAYPLGWREPAYRAFARELVERQPQISARELAERIVSEALGKEPAQQARDDITCGVVYFRRPRRTIVLTGPPFEKSRDGEYARMLSEFNGTRVICGGTTTTIVSRELKRPATLDLNGVADGVPPPSRMEGVDLITEGILTLTRTARLLEAGTPLGGTDPAARLARLLIESDVTRFVVGSRINEAHQDPSLPMDLEIRRNIVKRVARVLEDQYLKETEILCV
ncbi:MAG: serine/threonine protein phosphatase [Spirochaetaceae bacterium]|nr:MAG: serine/threonine protein phosphatase [Spirochaetaceae bacterium]